MRNRKYEEWKNKMKHLGKEKRIPVCGQFELTARCNLDCKMCYIHNQKSNSYRDRELDTEEWKQIFDEAYDAGMLFATLTGGECLLRDDFKELYLHLWNKRVMITILTNGILLDDEYVDFFMKHRPDTIQVSLYGCSEECYRRVTGHTGFEKVINNIEKMRDTGMDVCVVVTPSKYIVDDYINTLKFVQDKGFQTRLMEMLLFTKRYDSEATDHFLSPDEIINLSIQRTKMLREVSPVSDTPEPHGTSQQCPQGLVCNAGHGLAYVTWEGIMYPCVNAMIGGASLREMDYAEAWTRTKQSADEVVRGRECVGCPYDSVCPKCPTHRLLDLQGGRCNPAVCEMTRKLVAAGVKRLDIAEQGCE